MLRPLQTLLRTLGSFVKEPASTLENLALRQQVALLKSAAKWPWDDRRLFGGAHYSS